MPKAPQPRQPPRLLAPVGGAPPRADDGDGQPVAFRQPAADPERGRRVGDRLQQNRIVVIATKDQTHPPTAHGPALLVGIRPGERLADRRRGGRADAFDPGQLPGCC